MIDKVGIKNYKSIVDLEIELGRVNVIVGANGSGKTNILEAIALAAAANQNRLEAGDLESRLRLTSSEFMFPKFEDIDDDTFIEIINVNIKSDSSPKDSSIYLFNDENNEWNNLGKTFEVSDVENALKHVIHSDNERTKNTIKTAIQNIGEIENCDELFAQVLKDSDFDIKEKIPTYIEHLSKRWFNKPELNNYLIYSPEESLLREFSKEGQIRPLGRKGEGLFQHLKELISDTENNQNIMIALNEGLSLLDWFEEFEIPDNLFTEERRLNIADRFLKDTSKVFDQRSTNEGFLFLLFYLTLFNSPKTPAFFAIDNLENALNPKLVRKLITHLIEVAKKKGKQVIFTTHSPYVLDGLDLSDDEQRLFVVDRNIDGHTEVNRIPHRENRTKQLSELWMNGVLGGLPDNF